MPAKQLKNFTQHKLTVQPLVGDTVLTWDSVSGWPTVGDWFLRLDSVDLLTTEIVKVTSVNVGANQTTVVRGQEGTTASGLFVINSTGGNDLTAQTLVDSMVRLDTTLSQDLTGPLRVPTTLGGSYAATSYGSMPVKIAELVLGAAATSIVFSSIPTGFRHLFEAWIFRSDQATPQPVNLQLHGDGAANYNFQAGQLGGTATAWLNLGGVGATSIRVGVASGTGAPAGETGSGWLRIYNYATTTFRRKIDGTSGRADADTAAGQFWEAFHGTWKNTANAVDSTTLIAQTSNFVAGSMATLMGEP